MTSSKQTVQQATNAGINIILPNGIPLGASFSDDNWYQFEEFRHSEDIQNLSTNKLVEMFTQKSDPEAVRAWADCMRSQATKDFVRVVSEDFVNGKLRIVLQYNSPKMKRISNASKSPGFVTLTNALLIQGKESKLGVLPRKLYDGVPTQIEPSIRLQSRLDTSLTFRFKEVGDLVLTYRQLPRPPEFKRVSISVSSIGIHLNGGNEFQYSLRLVAKQVSGEQTAEWPASIERVSPTLVVVDVKKNEPLPVSLKFYSGAIAGGKEIELFGSTLKYEELVSDKETFYKSAPFNFRSYEARPGDLPQYGAVTLGFSVKTFK